MWSQLPAQRRHGAQHTADLGAAGVSWAYQPWRRASEPTIQSPALWFTFIARKGAEQGREVTAGNKQTWTWWLRATQVDLKSGGPKSDPGLTGLWRGAGGQFPLEVLGRGAGGVCAPAPSSSRGSRPLPPSSQQQHTGPQPLWPYPCPCDHLSPALRPPASPL